MKAATRASRFVQNVGADKGDGGRIPLRPVAAVDGGVVLGRHVGRVEDVLDADGNAVKRAARGLAIERARLRERQLGVEERPGPDLLLARGNAREAGFDELLARQLPGRDQARGLGGGELVCCARHGVTRRSFQSAEQSSHSQLVTSRGIKRLRTWK